jgi:hypothetical protein
MFVNDIYLTLVRRPLQGQAGTFDVMLTKLQKDGETIYTTDIIANVFHKLDLRSRDDAAV